MSNLEQLVRDLLEATDPDDVREVGGQPLTIARQNAQKALNLPVDEDDDNE